MTARELLAAATPRPWFVKPTSKPRVSNSTARAIVIDSDAADEYIAFDPLPADAAMVVAAVNEYEALLDIADAARDVQEIWIKSTTASRTGEELELDDALARLDEVRNG